MNDSQLYLLLSQMCAVASFLAANLLSKVSLVILSVAWIVNSLISLHFEKKLAELKFKENLFKVRKDFDNQLTSKLGDR